MSRVVCHLPDAHNLSADLREPPPPAGQAKRDVKQHRPATLVVVEDKENSAPRSTSPSNTSAPTDKAPPKSVYELPAGAAPAVFATPTPRSPAISRPVSYMQPMREENRDAPLTPRSAKHRSTPAAEYPAAALASLTTSTTTHSGGSRPGTVQAGAFRASANRARANSTPRPSEWIAPASLTKAASRPESPQCASPVKRQDPNEDAQGHARKPVGIEQKEANADWILYGLQSRPVSVVATPAPPTAVEKESSEPPTHANSQPPRTTTPPSRPPMQRAHTAHVRDSSEMSQPGQLTTSDATPCASQPMQQTRSQPIPNANRSSLHMDRTQSASSSSAQWSGSGSGKNSASRSGARPRSMTLTPADVEKAFGDMIVGPSGSAPSSTLHTDPSLNGQMDLDLPDTVAKKMLGLDLNVKSGMLKGGAGASSQSLGRSVGVASSVFGPSGSASYAAHVNARLPIPSFGEGSSSSNADGATGGSPKKRRPAVVRKMKSFIGKDSGTTEMPDGFLTVHTPAGSSSSGGSPTFASSCATSPISGTFSPSFDSVRSGTTGGSSTGISVAVSHSAAAQAHMLRGKTLRTLDPVKDLKKVRVLLRNESLEWVSEWTRFGGYTGLLERLHEVLAIEWREEMHDDAVLKELLKCFRALLMTVVSLHLCEGRSAGSSGVDAELRRNARGSLVALASPSQPRFLSVRLWSCSTPKRSLVTSLHGNASSRSSTVFSMSLLVPALQSQPLTGTSGRSLGLGETQRVQALLADRPLLRPACLCLHSWATMRARRRCRRTGRPRGSLLDMTRQR